jgi:hypothetical protein
VIRRSALPALAVLAALTLGGCGGSGSSEPVADGSSGTSTPSPDSTGTSSADGVRLTPQGTRLALGDTARVRWNPTQKTTGVAAITVTGLLKMPISAFRAWRLDRETRRSTPYFVHATVRNLGHTDLSHTPVPLYLLDQRETLLEASRFQARFTPCPSRPLPAGFKHGDKTSVCLVYFVPRHGKLVAISFRPTEDFSPITWQGHVVLGGRTHRRH